MSAADGLLLLVQCAQARYIVRREQLSELRRICEPADLERPDERGKPLVSRELDALLGADMRAALRRPVPFPRQAHHALIVPTRRRGVALLARRIDSLAAEAQAAAPLRALPPLLARSLHRPWFLGVLLLAEAPLLVLDLRQIAQDVLFAPATPV